MISTNEFRAGAALIVDGQLYTIIEYQHVKPGKGGAFVRTKLRKIKDGGVVERTFKAGDKFEDAFIEKKPLQFLYRSGDEFHFMDTKTYDQQMFMIGEVGDAANYLKENLEVRAELYNNKLIGMELPTTVDLKIMESEPGIRGDTSKSAMKPAIMETGFKVLVPLFVEPGEVVKVDTRTGQYAGRA